MSSPSSLYSCHHGTRPLSHGLARGYGPCAGAGFPHHGVALTAALPGNRLAQFAVELRGTGCRVRRPRSRTSIQGSWSDWLKVVLHSCSAASVGWQCSDEDTGARFSPLAFLYSHLIFTFKIHFVIPR